MALASQEQFEQEYADHTGQPVAVIREGRFPNDSYDTPKVSSAYHWWKRSRSTQVVDMTSVDFNNPGDILLALGKAGVQVEP